VEYTKKEAKDWAREKFHGLENILVPSLKMEKMEEGSMLNMDEEGIRHDVRECKRHKFFMCTAGIEGMPFMMMEMVMRDFWEIAVDEAKGEIFIDAYVSANSFDDTVAAARLAQECGCDSIMLAYPPYFNPKSEDEVFEFTKAVCDAIDIAVVAYPTHKYNFERFHTSSFSPALLSRICELENVVAAKLGVVHDISHCTHCFDLAGGKALLAAPSPQHWSTFVSRFGQQWAGSAPYEFLQDHEHTHAVDYFNLLSAGKFKEAMELYWNVFPKAKIMQDLLDYTVYEGVYNMMHFKYIGWLAGFNGGPITLPTARLYEHQKEALKAARAAMGLTNRAPDEEFYAGRVRFGKSEPAPAVPAGKAAKPEAVEVKASAPGPANLIFGTPEWLAWFVKALVSDQKFKGLSKNYEGGPLILRTYAQPGIHPLLERDLRMYFDAYHGDIKAARVLADGEDAKANIEMEGSFQTWKELATGKMGLKTAVLIKRKLKVKGPRVSELVKYMNMADRIMEVLKETKSQYKFPDER
jgi:4-hydroxy-tetrahydrodipicolinate synthase